MRVFFGLLGPMEIHADGVAIGTLPRRKARAMLAYLALAPGRRASRDLMATLLWGEKDEEHARANPRVALSWLRSALQRLDPAMLKADGEAVVLSSDVQTDVEAFEHSSAEGALAALLEAAALYRGDFLEDLQVREPRPSPWASWAERCEGVEPVREHRTSLAPSEAAPPQPRRCSWPWRSA